MKTHKILLILFAAFSGWCGTMNAQDADLKKRMKDADPKVIGTRIVNKFLVTPHTRFGNPRAEKAPNYVTYPDACTWLGALWFSKARRFTRIFQRKPARSLHCLCRQCGCQLSLNRKLHLYGICQSCF